MKKESKIIITLLVIIIIILCVVIFKKSKINPAIEDNKIVEVKDTKSEIIITEQDIKEENFTGTKSIITGTSVLANEARKYIDESISEFKKSADIDVPDMRKQFGADSPTANYEINVKATHTTSAKTESIIINEYVYTGGANGNSLYKVFTASLDTGKVLSLSDVIPASKQTDFTVYLKKRLIDWRPEGTEGLAVFEEEVKNLTFSSLDDWSYDKDNLIIYFDKYEIGPGVLGAVAFPIPLSNIKNFL